MNKGSYHWGTVTKDNGEAYRRVNNGAAKYPLPSEGKELLPVGDILRVIRRLLWVVLLVALLTAGIAVGVSLLQPPAYDATALVVVRPTQTTNSQAGFSNTITGLQTLAHEMAVVGLTPSMVDAVVNARSELPSPVSAADLHNNLKVEQLADTRFIQLSYSGTEPNETQAVTNLAAEAFARQMPEVSGVATDAVVTVSEHATLPKGPQSPNPLRNGLVAFAIGLILGIGSALLLDYFKVRSWQSPEEVESALGVPTFGAIPDFEEANHKSRAAQSSILRRLRERL